jgi:ubiquinone/menaquinone biosynthesis C-methylase UbiE
MAIGLQIDPGNREQLRAWDGDEGAYWADHAAQFDRSIGAYHGPFMEAAAIRSADHVLDVACGTGQTTRDAARAASAGSALGVDLSSRMIDYARRQAAAEGLSNARFEQADAQVHPFAALSFDVAISRTGVMFFSDPVAGLSNVGRALRPDGRLALLTWQPLHRQEWLPSLAGALAAGRDLPLPSTNPPSPFSFSEPDAVRNMLGQAGFRDVELGGFEESMHFGANAEGAYQFVLGLMGWMLQGLDEARRAQALEALRAVLTAHEGPEGVTFGSAAWLITARKETPR